MDGYIGILCQSCDNNFGRVGNKCESCINNKKINILKLIYPWVLSALLLVMNIRYLSNKFRLMMILLEEIMNYI